MVKTEDNSTIPFKYTYATAIEVCGNNLWPSSQYFDDKRTLDPIEYQSLAHRGMSSIGFN